jgi:hypothetical protein
MFDVSGRGVGMAAAGAGVACVTQGRLQPARQRACQLSGSTAGRTEGLLRNFSVQQGCSQDSKTPTAQVPPCQLQGVDTKAAGHRNKMQAAAGPEVGVAVGGALDCDLPQLHLVARQRAGLVGEHIRHLHATPPASVTSDVYMLRGVRAHGLAARALHVFATATSTTTATTTTADATAVNAAPCNACYSSLCQVQCVLCICSNVQCLQHTLPRSSLMLVLRDLA